MPRKKILLSVTTYPLPSRNYDELVCTAGFLEDGSWIRLYPVPLSFLSGLKRSGVVQQTKYTWIELDVEKRTDDFRPESHSPRDYEFKDFLRERLGIKYTKEVFQIIPKDLRDMFKKVFTLQFDEEPPYEYIINSIKGEMKNEIKIGPDL
jgi:hypothetical protein